MTTEENNNNNNDHPDGNKEPEEDGLLSPRSMAVAAVTDAMQEKQQQQQQQLLQDKQDQDTHNDKSNKSKRSRKHKNDDLHLQLEEIWNGKESDDDDTKAQAIQETFRLIGNVMTELMQDGMEAFHGWEQTRNQVQTLKEECDSKDRELGRLRTSEQKSRESITVSERSQVYCYVECGWRRLSIRLVHTALYLILLLLLLLLLFVFKNLLRAVETSKVQARDQSEATLHQARMRADLLHVTTQKDQALGDGHETKRRLALVEEELRHTKSKLSKITQEKIQLERDQRATLALAKSLQGNAHSDVDYYKRKVCRRLFLGEVSFRSILLVSHACHLIIPFLFVCDCRLPNSILMCKV
jgi:hypothetical protein